MNKNILKYYFNQNLPQTTVKIEGVEFGIVKLPVSQSSRVLNRTAKIALPLLGVLDKDEMDFSSIMSLDDELLSKHIIDLCQMCKIGDRLVIVDNDIGSLKMLYLLAWEFLKFNYQDFLQGNPLAKKVQKATGINLNSMK